MSDSDKLLYPDLSYKIVGIVFRVFNKTGYGMPEKYYQAALEEEFIKEGLSFRREFCVHLKYEEKNILRYFIDFLIEDKIVVEIKVKPKIGYVRIKQVTSYLKAANCQLAILFYFTQDGVKYRRVIDTPNKLAR